MFACGSCGDPLKKNQVEKHCQFKCKKCDVLSCIDCGKDFWGDSYKEHTKCISEEEKYSGKDFKPRPGANKGEVKQEAWFQQVQQAIDSVNSSDHRLKELLERLKEFPNIPRKKAKFENFVKNSVRVGNVALVTQAWDAISASLSNSNGNATERKNSDSNDKNTNLVLEKETDNGSAEKKDAKLSKRERKEERRKLAKKGEKKDKEETENGNESKKSKKQRKKRKHEEDEEDDTKENEQEVADGHKSKSKNKSKKIDTEDELVNKKQRTEDVTEEEELTPAEGTFKWESAIIGVLKRAPDNEISVKKLRKKVLCEYAARGGDSKPHLSEEKLLAKFQKKITKNPRLKVHKEKVKLLK